MEDITNLKKTEQDDNNDVEKNSSFELFFDIVIMKMICVPSSHSLTQHTTKHTKNSFLVSFVSFLFSS